ncbi:kelch domain-containing protein 2-like isoform X1 [Lampetra fluviatilis]
MFRWRQPHVGDLGNGEPEPDDAGQPRSEPEERSGHIAVFCGTRMYVWGGYLADNSVDLYLPSSEMWIYDTETQVWHRRELGGELPPPMSGSCAVCVDGRLYMFGGHHHRGNSNEFYTMDLCPRGDSYKWERISNYTGQPPSPKDKLGCWTHGNKLVFFGGYGYQPREAHRGTFEFDETSLWGPNVSRGWNNHVHIFDLETYSWSQPLTTGTPPLPRAAHACATHGNRGYLFGGRYLGARMNDLHYLNLDNWAWSGPIAVRGEVPLGRSWHTLTAASDDQLFLYGGFTTERQPLGDGWIYSVKSQEWRKLSHIPPDRPRLWHTATLSEEGEVLVFGGCSNNLLAGEMSGHKNDVLVFCIQPKSLLRLSVDAVARHRELLCTQWGALPRHLSSRLLQRTGGPASGS